MSTINQLREPSSPVVPRTGALRPLGLGEVRITGGFWGERQSVNGSATLQHIGHWLEHEGWLGNFDLAASGGLPEGRRGAVFADSEIYKYLEALAWEIGRTGDTALQRTFDSVVARVEAAQEADGYLSTSFGREGQRPRWSDLEWGHELYCLGHLFQAAVARLRTGHGADDRLVRVATRAADLVCEVFGPAGIQSICGHAEVEVGLTELARATGEERYLQQAKLFVERHGNGTLRDIEFGRSYYQDDVPVRDADVLRGHAVRANYLSAAAVDVAVDTGDDELLSALTTQWRNTVARRTYITGGQGSHHQGEAFGEDWVLPPDRAYSETCAAVGSVMFSWRLLLARGSAEYADLIERTLFNVVATSPSAEGTSFFYANTLHRRTPAAPVALDEVSPRPSSSLRAPWFEVSCCPPNVARTFASLAAYFATKDERGIQLHQYAPAEIATALEGDRRVALRVETDYPVSGVIRVTVDESPATAWALTLRVPAWAGSGRVTVRGADGSVDEREAASGWAVVDRVFARGDVVELDLPIRPRFTSPDPHIDAVRGTVAVERGPEVLSLESVDLAAAGLGETDIADLEVDTTVPPTERDGRVFVSLRAAVVPQRPWPYGPSLGPVVADAAVPGPAVPSPTVPGPGISGPVVSSPTVPGPTVADAAVAGPAVFDPAVPGSTAPASGADVALVPYHDWARRGPSAMRVWIPRSQ